MNNRYIRAALFLGTVGFLCLVWTNASSAQTKATWQEKWEKALAEAKKGGKVVVMGSLGDLIRDAMTQVFKKAFPEISIEYSGARGGELATRVKTERDAGIYSVDIVLSWK